MAKAKLIQAPMKGVFGETVNVGDKVMAVTTSWGNAYVAKGTYIGYIEGSGYYKQCAQIESERERRVLVKPDGTPFNWKKDYNGATWSEVQPTLTYKTEKYIRTSTLKLNRIATIKE